MNSAFYTFPKLRFGYPILTNLTIGPRMKYGCANLCSFLNKTNGWSCVPKLHFPFPFPSFLVTGRTLPAECFTFLPRKKYGACIVISRQPSFVGGLSKKKHKHTTEPLKKCWINLSANDECVSEENVGTGVIVVGSQDHLVAEKTSSRVQFS